MTADCPFALELRATKGPGLSARLVNRSAAALPLLHDARLQPSRLVLTAADGAEIEAFDGRALMKYDPRIYCARFQSLPAGKEIDLGEARFTRRGDGWSLTWGPYEFESLAAGRYTAHLAWTSEADSCQDAADSPLRPVTGVWLGTVESNRVEVTLR